MKRSTLPPRDDWENVVTNFGIKHAGRWEESAFYELTPLEVQEIKLATDEVHTLCLKAVAHVIEKKLYDKLGISAEWVPMIERSWARHDPVILGRLDFGFDGAQPPKLIKYRADGCEMLIETAHQQFQRMPDGTEQFNDLMEMLPKRWDEAFGSQHVHFSCFVSDPEALSNTIFMREMALADGCTSADIDMKDIGWNSARGYFVDLDDIQIKILAKNYPWDWMLKESFGAKLLSDPCKSVEPAWTILLNSKGILDILWRLFPNHPNLLPANPLAFALGGNEYVRKPLFGRGGKNVSVHTNQGVEEHGGVLETDAFICQGLAPIPNFDGHFPVISSFVVGDKPAGLGIREDKSIIGTEKSKFVPHAIKTP